MKNIPISSPLPSMSSTIHTEQIRQRLDERARQLAQLIEAGQRPSDRGVEVADQKDSANDEAQMEIDSAEVELHLAELRQIEQARARLADGSYGQCVDCGETIAPARLLAQPTAVRCTACQSVAERHVG